MNVKLRNIEVDAETAEALEAQAAARGTTVRELIADLASSHEVLPSDLEALRLAGKGPWTPEILAEDVRRLADFQRTGEGIPWDEVQAWMHSWGSSEELPPPKPRKL